MGNNSSSGGSSSVGDYSNKGSFGKAFNAAHTTHGSGKQFTYNGKSYTTNCADGNEYKGGSKNNFTYSQLQSGTLQITKLVQVAVHILEYRYYLL